MVVLIIMFSVFIKGLLSEVEEILRGSDYYPEIVCPRLVSGNPELTLYHHYLQDWALSSQTAFLSILFLSLFGEATPPFGSIAVPFPPLILIGLSDCFICLS